MVISIGNVYILPYLKIEGLIFMPKGYFGSQLSCFEMSLEALKYRDGPDLTEEKEGKLTCKPYFLY